MTQDPQKRPRSVYDRLLPEIQLSQELEAYQGFSDRVWSMGRVADLLWRHSAPARPLIRRRMVDELDSALEDQRMPWDTSNGVLLLDYLGSVLRPLLDGYPDTAEALEQELQLIRYVAPYRGPDETGYVTELFDEYILYWLRTDQYRPVVEDCAPEIAAILSAQQG